MLSVVPSVLVLGLAALAALLLLRRRRSPPDKVGERYGAARALAVALAVQGLHFAEQIATGFDEALPAAFGLPAIPPSIFVIFNLTWLGIWVASVPGLRSARPFAFFAAWFLAIAGIINGVAHPLLAVATGRYFPGLVSSPFICAASIRVWLRLRQATGARTA